MASLFPSSFKPTTTLVPPSTPSDPQTSLYALHHVAPSPTPSGRKLLVLIHGYPQSSTLWYKVVEELGKEGSILNEFDILIPDLPGYGQSTKPASSDGSHFNHSKKAVSTDIINLINSLYSSSMKFVVVGHDRGARVGYKLTKDYAERVLGLCVQDIVPTRVMFGAMNLEKGHKETRGSYHWIFLSLPSPFPETFIGKDPAWYFTHTIDSWTGKRLKGKLDPLAMDSWVSNYSNPENIIGSLEDYRAGVTLDCADDLSDEQSGKNKISCELLVMFSIHLSKRFEVKAVWEAIGDSQKIKVVEVGDEGTGHFLPVEAEEEVTKEMVEFLRKINYD